VESCIACDLAEGRVPLPGGRIHETTHWLVEHCVGPLGVGTLIVKPRRHVAHVWELTEDEARELGPLLRETSKAAAEFIAPEQVYVCLWSHGPAHIHFVVQPVTQEQMDDLSAYGPRLQVAMFDRNEAPPEPDVEAATIRLRERLAITT
jgi:ATP adenylyltransferase